MRHTPDTRRLALQQLETQGCHTPPVARATACSSSAQQRKKPPRPNAHRGCASHLPRPRTASPSGRRGWDPGLPWQPQCPRVVGGRAAAAISCACARPGTRPSTHRWNREAPFPGLGRFSSTLGDDDKARTEALSGTAAGGSPPEAASSARLKRLQWRGASPVATPRRPRAAAAADAEKWAGAAEAVEAEAQSLPNGEREGNRAEGERPGRK